MARGFLYLVAVMDWVSRYVLAWRLSNLLDASFCIEALEDALSQGQPEIFYRTGQSVHRRRLYRRAASPWGCHQHGRPRPLCR